MLVMEKDDLMADLSFKVWHVRLNCDHPQHRKVDPDSSDWESTEPEATWKEVVADARAAGWIFHRDGRLTCPTCASTGVRRERGCKR